MADRAEIGVFGGSGFGSLLEDAREIEVETPYGTPSAPVTLAEVGGRAVAFLPRHGRRHEHPPHRIPYRANLWAMKELGVQRIVAPTAAGSLQRDVHPGDFVVCDQMVDRTSGRAATYYDGPETTHVSLADPYCPDMRRVAIDVGAGRELTLHGTGTVVVIEGPRFATRAESRWYSQMGWRVINMTQHPECALARELEICYLNVSLITDYDAGVEGISPVSVDEILEVFKRNNERLREYLLAIIPALPAERSCPCATALSGARVGH